MMFSFYLPIWAIILLAIVAAVVLSGFLFFVAAVWVFKDDPKW